MKIWTDKKIFEEVEVNESHWLPYFVEELVKREYDFQIRKDELLDVFTIDIRYTDITITNSNGLSEYLGELFVRVILNEHLVTAIEGVRYVMTEEQMFSNYIHSHLPTNHYNYFNRFCLGEGYLGHYKLSNYITPSQESAQLFFILLDDFVKWESLEGGPHTKIESIGLPGSKIGPTNHIFDIYKLQTRSDEIDFVIKNNRVVVNPKWIESQLTTNCVEVNGEYYSMGSAPPSEQRVEEVVRERRKNNESYPFTFKGERQILQVVKSDKPRIAKPVVHPITIKNYATKLSRKIEKWLLEKDSFEEQIQNESTTESVGTNDVPVF